MAAMMRQSHTNIHPAKESKGNGRRSQDPDEAQWLGSPPTGCDALSACPPATPRAAPKLTRNQSTNAQDGNKLRLTSRLTPKPIPPGQSGNPKWGRTGPPPSQPVNWGVLPAV